MHYKEQLKKQKNMIIAIADNLQKIRVNLGNLRGMGEYMSKYADDFEKIKKMANDCERTLKQSFSLLVKTEDIIRYMKKNNEKMEE